MRLLLTAAVVIFTASAMAQQPRGFVTLQQLRDTTRPLLIFAPKPDDPQLEIQLRTLQQHASEAADRQIVPLAITSEGPSPTDAHLSNADGDAARRRFHVTPGEFTVILIGKDGGEKLRSKKPFNMDKLNRTIDAMPMRRAEMQKTPDQSN